MAEEIQNKETQTSYRSIFKATSLFGGVQIYQILVGVVKSKFLAILLGPAGMGIQGLYQSTLDVVKSLTSFGLEQSAVRDISEANGTNNEKRVGNTVAIVRRLVWLTGVLGFLITLLMSPYLSKWTFGNSDYTWGFAILSVTLLFNQICSGQKVLLQGMRRLKDLAKASAIGSTIGLLVSIPLYYWIGVKGIVPTMVLTSVSALLLTWYYSSKVPVEIVKVETKEAIVGGRSMIKMGLAMSFSGILTTISAYLLRWFIREKGGIDEVGLYSAGLLVTNTYVGMIFSAMGTDYYPRLAAVNKDNERCREVINQQGEVAILLIAPIILSCIVFMPLIIRIIYSTEFLAAGNYILFAVAGMIFKATSWTISYSFLAKAESRLFIVNETISNLYFLLNNILGYIWGGLTGLGISYMLSYLIYMFQVLIITKRRYGYEFSREFYRLFFIQLAIISLSVVLVYYSSSRLIYLPLSVFLLSCNFFSIRELNKRTDLIKTFTTKYKKHK